VLTEVCRSTCVSRHQQRRWASFVFTYGPAR